VEKGVEEDVEEDEAIFHQFHLHKQTNKNLIFIISEVANCDFKKYFCILNLYNNFFCIIAHLIFLLSNKTTFRGLPHYLNILTVMTTIFILFGVLMLDLLDVLITIFLQLPTL
jgi:hypothetical protein